MELRYKMVASTQVSLLASLICPVLYYCEHGNCRYVCQLCHWQVTVSSKGSQETMMPDKLATFM